MKQFFRVTMVRKIKMVKEEGREKERPSIKVRQHSNYENYSSIRS